jgi:mRNA-degrading endonuclease RelE of RelBE toxin-antitoxin system
MYTPEPSAPQYFPLRIPYLGRHGGTVARVASSLDTTSVPLSDLILKDVAQEPHSEQVVASYLLAPIDRYLYEVEQESTWFFGLTDDFRKQIDNIDRKIQGRILLAISDIVLAPVEPHGDTRKPLTREERFRGCWRHRIGDYRLVYFPDVTEKRVLFLSFDERGGAYD